MPKFTDERKWSDPWFRRLDWQLKLSWLYLLDQCDIAGIAYLDYELADFKTGHWNEWDRLVQESGRRIHKIAAGVFWVPSVIQWHAPNFQLSPNCPCHRGIIKRLTRAGLLEKFESIAQSNGGHSNG